MKILMLLVWLSGGFPNAEVRLFDNVELCMAYGQFRIDESIAKRQNIKWLLTECQDIVLESTKEAKLVP